MKAPFLVVLAALSFSGVTPLLGADVRQREVAPESGGRATVDSGPTAPFSRSLFTLAPSTSAGMTFTLEKARANFGAVTPGMPAEIADAAVIRVVSSSAWVLKLAPRGPSTHAAGSEALPMERLSWRVGGLDYRPLRTVQQLTVAEGGPTSVLGSEVRLDLRLEVSDDDPLAPLALELAIYLESR